MKHPTDRNKPCAHPRCQWRDESETGCGYPIKTEWRTCEDYRAAKGKAKDKEDAK
jgi:hypothetical protein